MFVEKRFVLLVVWLKTWTNDCESSTLITKPVAIVIKQLQPSSKTLG